MPWVVDDPEVANLVKVRWPAGDWSSDAGTRDLFAEDRVDQGGLADTGLAEIAKLNRPMAAFCFSYSVRNESRNQLCCPP